MSMKWECDKSAAGHALAPARDEEALWSGWACSHCGERFAWPGDPDSFELPLMERVVEVDALALMLDGSTSPKSGMRLVGLVGSLASGLSYSGGAPLLERYLRTEDDVAQAILELEGSAGTFFGDVTLFRAPLISAGLLAEAAWEAAPKHKKTSDSIVTRNLEAAAILRDGWRPGKRAKRRAS